MLKEVMKLVMNLLQLIIFSHPNCAFTSLLQLYHSKTSFLHPS